MPMIFHLTDFVDGATVVQFISVAARLALLSPSVDHMLVRLRLLWRGARQTGEDGRPERQDGDRRDAIDQGIVTTNGESILDFYCDVVGSSMKAPSRWSTRAFR